MLNINTFVNEWYQYSKFSKCKEIHTIPLTPFRQLPIPASHHRIDIQDYYNAIATTNLPPSLFPRRKNFFLFELSRRRLPPPPARNTAGKVGAFKRVKFIVYSAYVSYHLLADAPCTDDRPNSNLRGKKFVAAGSRSGGCGKVNPHRRSGHRYRLIPGCKRVMYAAINRNEHGTGRAFLRGTVFRENLLGNLRGQDTGKGVCEPTRWFVQPMKRVTFTT